MSQVLLLLAKIILISSWLIALIRLWTSHIIIEIKSILNWRNPHCLLSLNTLLLLLVLIPSKSFTSKILQISCTRVSIYKTVINNLTYTLVKYLVFISSYIGWLIIYNIMLFKINILFYEGTILKVSIVFLVNDNCNYCYNYWFYEGDGIFFISLIVYYEAISGPPMGENAISLRT